MSTLLLLTSALQPSAEVLPALALLGHQVKILPSEGSALLEAPDSDLLLVDGDPTDDIDLVADPDANFKIIMKDGLVYKNELRA